MPQHTPNCSLARGQCFSLSFTVPLRAPLLGAAIGPDPESSRPEPVPVRQQRVEPSSRFDWPWTLCKTEPGPGCGQHKSPEGFTKPQYLCGLGK